MKLMTTHLIRCTFALTTTLLFLASVLKASTVENFPVEDIKPGMRGTTLTVMQGTEIISLETELLGVLKNGLGPGKDLIIGKLVDERTRLTGAVHGMSGSPLYVQGKLVGALSRRLMSFEKDGHCGFTPIADMLDVQNRGQGKQLERTGLSPFLSAWNSQAASAALSKSLTPQLDTGSWLSVPLGMSGWSEGMISSMGELFRGMTGLLPVSSSSSGGSSKTTIEMKPGSALSVVLIDGDLKAGGTGTATTVDGSRVTGFGHPMMGIGPTELPMAAAEIITTMPSYLVPHKISNIGALCGTIWQDRLSAVSGELGAIPKMAQYEIHKKHEGQNRPSLKGTFVKEEWIAPQLMAMLLARAVMDQQDFSEDSTLQLRGEIVFKGLPKLEIRGLYSGGMSERFRSLFDQLSPLMNLYSSFPKQIEVEAFRVKVETFERASQWQLETLNVREQKLVKGQTVQALLKFKNGLGQARFEEVELSVPEELKQTSFSLRAIAGAQLQAADRTQKNLVGSAQASDLIRALNQYFEPNVLFLQLITNEEGTMSRNQLQLGLPYSVSKIRTGTEAESLRIVSSAKVWTEKRVTMPGVVTGSLKTELEIK